MGERVAAERLGDPERPVSERLEPLRVAHGLRRRHRLGEVPDAGRAEPGRDGVHADFVARPSLVCPRGRSVGAKGSAERRSLDIFVISLAALLVEISFTRVISFKLFYYYTYLAIGLALLGIGSGGVIVATSTWLRSRSPTRSSGGVRRSGQRPASAVT